MVLQLPKKNCDLLIFSRYRLFFPKKLACLNCLLALFLSLYFSNTQAQSLFPRVATITESEDSHYRNKVTIWEFFYIPDWSDDTEYCSVSSIQVSGLNCNSNSDERYHFNGIQVAIGSQIDNLEQDGRFLSCEVNDIGEGLYKLTASSRNPQQTTLHTVIVSEIGSRVIDYSGVKTYDSYDNGRIATENYIPIRSRNPDSDDGSLYPFSLVPLNCENLLIPTIHE